MIAAEIALAHDIRARGEGTALAAAAAPDAVLFAPRLVWAGPWLKAHAGASTALSRQPYAVWSSCDGSLVVSRGAWQRGGTGGWFTTIWRREPNGAYKWVLDHLAPVVAAAPAAPEMLTALVADCPERARPEALPPQGQGRGQRRVKAVKLKDQPPLDPARHGGAAADGSIRWEATVRDEGAPQVAAWWKKDGGEAVLPGAPGSP